MGIQKLYAPQTGSPPSVPMGSSIIDQPKIGLVSIPTASLLTLHSVPMQLVAGKVGYLTIFEWAAIEIITTSTAFAGGGVLQINYSTTTGTIVHASTIPATFVTNATPGTYVIYLAPFNPANGLVVPVGEGLSLTAAAADFTTGTGRMYVHTSYRHLQVI